MMEAWLALAVATHPHRQQVAVSDCPVDAMAPDVHPFELPTRGEKPELFHRPCDLHGSRVNRWLARWILLDEIVRRCPNGGLGRTSREGNLHSHRKTPSSAR